MGSELVSVTIVGYNNWPDLELAIQSALCQSHEAIEVIVVDNSSTDATQEEVPRRFGDRVRYIRQPNTGDSGAYNTGIRVASGAFIQFLDGDDVLAPNKIEKQLEIFRKEPDTDVVYGDIRYFQALAGQAAWVEAPAPTDQGDMLKGFLVPSGGMIHFLGSLHRKSALTRTGMFDETLYNADADYVLRELWNGCRFRYCEGNPLAFYRIRPGQMSANTGAMIKGLEAVLAKALGYIDREPYRTAVMNHLAWAQFFRATKRYDLTRREAMSKLTQARATDRRIVPFGLYLIGMALIHLPGGRRLMRSDGARRFRRGLAKFLGFRVP